MDSQRTIFIIDDCEEDRMVYRRLLERDTRYTYKIVEFESATEAIESCQSWIPDLILVDFMLPDATGLEFLEELKFSIERNHLPVIMLTGQGDESIAVQAMKSGAQDYLVKGKLTDDVFYRASHTVMERVRLMQQVDSQQEQQRLMGAIALRIRLSLSLEIVLTTAVEEIRDFLKADRVIVYQFHPDNSGTIVAESVVSGWKSCLNVKVEDTCFQGARGKYHRNRAGAVNDTHQAALSDCHVELLEYYQVRANLYVPIFSGIQPVEANRCLLRNEPPVWGLLVAHQCGSPRQWQQSEMDLLEQLSVQLAIAIQQAELYENLQSLNAQLEAKVEDRTAKFQQSERKFRAIFEQTFQLIGLLTPQGEILELNQAFLEFFGADRDRLKGKLFWELPCYKKLTMVHDGLQKAIVQASIGNFVRYEVTLPDARGIQRTIDFSIKPILNEIGEVVLLLPEGRDITERKQAEEALCDLNEELEARVQQRTQDLEQANISLRSEISERQRIELELLRNRDLREAIFNESADAIFLVDEDTRRIIDCNRRAVKLFEASSKEELINDNDRTLQHYPLTFQELEKLTEEVKKKGFWSREIEYLTLKGNSFWGNLAVKQITVAGTVRNLVRVTDISDRKQAVEQLEHSLEEKETLLKEIHHRVKNNLQIISSLLRMQSRRVRDESTMILFQESQNRVQSMALIHEHLYQSPEISHIDFGEYIRSLTDNLFRCYGISQKTILLKIETGGIKLNLDTAIPCGLLINELISNSLKYAFPEGRRGEISIRLVSSTDNTIILIVSDTGIGIPDSLDWSNTNSLGLRIVHNLTRQLKGTLTLDRDRGTAFHITFAH
ncbi:histidine kinase dimerization/phosphoacceptor domain -containing protein [Scytonema sp. NUACC26]|uniref:histidine kinase dimerization/phosphoacceptor domain -containing protein n=1 Tax=Scytonema sp. NUACC26 TaxID=3140176 RepID=UPI0034DC057B